MTSCLLCQAPLRKEARFSDLFWSRRVPPGICQDCQKTFLRIGQPSCPSCFKSGHQDICGDCQYWQQLKRSVNHQSLYVYNQAMKAYFSQYKFQGDYVLRWVFASSLRSALKRESHNRQLIPIPISTKRLQERGFNQVTGLLEAAGLTYDDCLLKKESDKQSDKGRKDRLRLGKVFLLKEGVQLQEKVLLVDDVYTTGATLQVACDLLRSAGARDIKTLSLAR